jgi:phosphoglucomutase
MTTGKPRPPAKPADISRLVSAYYESPPKESLRVAFGTSGHRGSALSGSFNEVHVLAIAQAICLYRASANIDGPLFLGIDTHALSEPAAQSAIEVFAANGITVMVDSRDGFTPTPALSLAILAYNRGRQSGLADGVIVTPSHNPPEDGGFKYNPPHGGPAEPDVTRAIERLANDLLGNGLRGVRRLPLEQARRSSGVRRYDYLSSYVDSLAQVIEMDAIRTAGIRIGIDPLGGASLDYWSAILDRYSLDGQIVRDTIDHSFAFMPPDGDGRIRMDCSSPFAMAELVGLKDRFDIGVGNDPDADRHGIVTASSGLLNPNHYLAAAASYLFSNRPCWPSRSGLGKTMVTSALLDRVAVQLHRPLIETPVGFRWFVAGLLDGSLGFAGEESAGASLLRKDGTVWTTDKDGIALALLAAEIAARSGRLPDKVYDDLASALGTPYYRRTDAPATPAEMERLKGLSPSDLKTGTVAGEVVVAVENSAPDGAPLGGIRVRTANGWFAVRPSGTEDIYKLYAESFLGPDHLEEIEREARAMVRSLLSADRPNA